MAWSCSRPSRSLILYLFFQRYFVEGIAAVASRAEGRGEGAPATRSATAPRDRRPSGPALTRLLFQLDAARRREPRLGRDGDRRRAGRSVLAAWEACCCCRSSPCPPPASSRSRRGSVRGGGRRRPGGQRPVPYRRAPGSTLGCSAPPGWRPPPSSCTNLVIGLGPGDPFGWALATLAGWGLVALWCAALVAWPLVVDPARADRPLARPAPAGRRLLLVDPRRLARSASRSAIIAAVSTC